MSAIGDAIDAALQREATWERADATRERFGEAIGVYGASVGSVRAAVRDSLRGRDPLTHDEVAALSTELWSVPVHERRLAAIVLLQTHVPTLDNGDLTRLEGFVRTARVAELVDALATEVVGPLVRTLGEPARSRSRAVLARWASDANPWLGRAAKAALSAPSPE